MKLGEFRELMRNQALEDKKQKYVNVSAPSMPEALRKAAIELGIASSRIAYEVLQKGNAGTFGIGRKDFIILAYPGNDRADKAEAGAVADFDFGGASSSNGEACVRKTGDGVMLRVTAPAGGGVRVSEAQALGAIEAKTGERINMQMVARAVKRADGEWVKVADLVNYEPSQDAQIEMELADMEMKAYVTLGRPGPNGADASAARIRSYLELNHVGEGFLDDALQRLENNPVYGEPVLVAEGRKPQNGEDAKIIYSFETEKKFKIREIEGGRVDFKDLNTINNVVEGQVLAKLVPPQRGVSGLTVTGKLLPAKDGKDKPMVIGNNVKLSDDKKQAIALTNGQVLVIGDKISVEPIYTVDGNVNLKSGGNIVFLGSVEVKGNVEDGYSIKAAGNIEVLGTVERCEIDSEGDIIVHNGITGKSGAHIKAGGNIWAKFIENADIEAGGIVVVSEGIINSNIQCDHKIICRGKRASIVGGHIRASEEVDAKSLGSVAGVETTIEVGYDPKLKTELENQQNSLKNLQKEQADVDLNIASLDKLIKAKKDQAQEKKDHFENLKQHSAELGVQIQGVQDEIGRLTKLINELKNNGKISASGKVYQGTKIVIKDAFLDVRSEYRAVSFVAEMGIVKMTRYEESDQDISIVRAER